MVSFTVFRSFGKGGEIYQNSEFAKHCDMDNKFKSKISLGWYGFYIDGKTFWVLPIAIRPCCFGLADSRFEKGKVK
jgi:hypothetical protein